MLGFPGPSLHFNAARALHCASLGMHEVTICQTGLGAWDGFNALWADALNAYADGKITHFAMLHSDIAAGDGWLDTLLAEMESHAADVMSAVVPIKDVRGVTSTAIGGAGPWQVYRRLTMREVFADTMPETFSAADFGYPNRPLLVNDGCMVVDLRNPLFHNANLDGQAIIYFGFPSDIVRGENGRWQVRRESEDWFFSRSAADAGAKIMATRKVPLKHIGAYPFPGNEAWGKYIVDEDSLWHREQSIDGHGCWRDAATAEKYHLRDASFENAVVEFLGATAKRVADFGCGRGDLVRALLAAGVKAVGYDGNPDTEQLTEGLGIRADIAEPLTIPNDVYDWCCCLEVLEHIPPAFEKAAIDNLCRHARTGLIVSSAPPGQAGLGHCNERTESYVLQTFANRNFRCDEAASDMLCIRNFPLVPKKRVGFAQV